MRPISRRDWLQRAALGASAGVRAPASVGLERAHSAVPEPLPAATDYLIGAHYFPGWRQGGHLGWDPIVPYPNRTPLLGYYDEGNPEVADWEIKWCLEHGITYFVYCWYRGSKGGPVSAASIFLGHAMHEGLFKAGYGERFRFAIMYENDAPAWGVTSLDDLLNNLLEFWIEEYFKRPGYLKIDNQPVLYVYKFVRMIENLGGVERVRDALERMRQACRRKGFAGLLVLAEYRGRDPAILARVRDCGFDANFAYCLQPNQKRPTAQEVIASQMDTLSFWRHRAVLPFVPTASSAWDPMPWRNEAPEQFWLNLDKMTRWCLSPEQFQRVLEWCKGLMDQMPAKSLARRMLLLDNWNEWGEGHHIAPHAGAGFGYLKAVREVFTRRDNRPDYRSPWELGLGPYDSLWRKHVLEKGVVVEPAQRGP